MQRTPMSLKFWSGVYEDSWGSWLGFRFLMMMGWVNNVPNNLCSKIQLSTLNIKVQRTLMSSKSWSGVMQDSGGYWLWFRFLIMIEMGLKCPKFSFLPWIKGCKEPSCLQSPGLGIWRTLEVPDWGLVPDHDGNVLPHTSWFCRYRNLPKLLSY